MAAQALARVLGRAGGEVAVQSLLEMLNDKDYNAREDAARALGQIGDPRAVLPLIQVLEQQGGNAGNHLLASAAAQALGQIGDPRAVPPLFKLLDVAPPLVREAAVRALGRINDPAAAQALSEAATKVVVVTAVAKVLTEIDDPRAIKPLLLLARDRIYAKRVVNHLCQIMQLCAGNVSPEDLSALVHIGQVWQAEWYHNEHDDDYGWSDDSHPVDTAGLVQLASEELKRRASQR
jgi:HEAT repeat protein